MSKTRPFTEQFYASEFADSMFMLPKEFADRFVVLERLSINELGETYLLSDADAENRFVLKRYWKSYMSGNSGEVELIKGLQHKGLPHYEGEAETEDSRYVLYQFVEGLPLSEYILAHGVLDEETALRVALDLCGILSCLHTQPAPIIHRDIKPSNIIMNPDAKTVTLIDFGISRKYAEESGSDTMVFGTRPYSAPEQYGYQQSDARTDVYALGVVLRFMLTGSADGIIQDKRLQKIATKCTAFSPSERYQSAESLQKALLAFRNHTSVKAKKVVIASATIALLLMAVWIGGMHVGSFFSFQPKPTSDDSSYVFADPMVEMAVRANLWKEDGDTITLSDLARVTGLYFVGENVVTNVLEYYDARDSYRETPGPLGTLMDLSDVRHMVNLGHFHMIGQPIEDISPLADCGKLLNLSLDRCGKLRSVAPLANSPTIQHMDIMRCDISDISSLSKLPALRSLNIDNAYVDDYSCFEKMGAMRELGLWSMPLLDISELGDLSHITHLSLIDLPLDNLIGIESFENLAVLDINLCLVKDFSPLDGLPELQKLMIDPMLEGYVAATMNRPDVLIKRHE